MMRVELNRRGVLALGAGLVGAACTARAAEPTPLATRPIPRSGEALPVVGLGTAVEFDVGDDPARRRACADVIRGLIAGGGRLIDTAPSYGRAEPLIGELLAETGLAARAFLATKLETFGRARMNFGDFEASLRRLRVAKVDLLQLHNVDDEAQELGPLRDWQARGLCRYVGITTSSNRAFAAIEAVLRRQKPDFLEVDYSLADRAAEARVLPAAAEVGAAVLVDLPFGRNRLFRAVRGRAVPDWARDFDATTWGQFFLKYLLANPAVTAVIPGTGNPAHMDDDLAAGRGRLPDAAQRRRMVEFIESLG